MAENKFEVVDTKEHEGHTLYRIKAMKNFSDIKKDDLGGWIENKDSLSQTNYSWVYPTGIVYGDSTISKDAKIYGKVFNSTITDDAVVLEKGIIDDTELLSNVIIDGTIKSSKIFGGCKVFSGQYIENTLMYGNTILVGKIKIISSNVCNALIYGDNIFIDDTKVQGAVIMGDDIHITNRFSGYMIK